MNKKLYRSEHNRIIAGICGGVGEYFDVDPVVVRLIYLLITVFTGLVPGIVTYLLAMLIVPERSHAERFHQAHHPEP
jgi:phage shock protein C